MNTPGGLDTSMRQIISAILASPVPVVSYVAPSGARAASAGTYIAYASALAAMAPGTNIGAATPVALGGPMLPGGSAEQKQSQQNKSGESGDTETRKVVNDAIAYIRSLAALNGRNADWAADAVRSAVSLPAADALSLHVIDVVADDVPDLLRQIDGRTVKVAGKPQRLATAGLDVTTVPPDWRTELLGARHQSQCRVHSPADRRLRADPRILQSRRRRARPHRRHQSFRRALRAWRCCRSITPARLWSSSASA